MVLQPLLFEDLFLEAAELLEVLRPERTVHVEGVATEQGGGGRRRGGLPAAVTAAEAVKEEAGVLELGGGHR